MSAIAAAPQVSFTKDAVEDAVHKILQRSDYEPGCPVKVVRKRLEKMLNLPKKALKAVDNDILALVQVFICIDLISSKHCAEMAFATIRSSVNKIELPRKPRRVIIYRHQ